MIVRLVNQLIDFKQRLVNEKSETKRELIKKQIQDTDYEIDQMVYKLYGLTKKEIKIVEESLK